MQSIVPTRPTLDGLEEKWARRWEEGGIYRFDRSASRDQVYSIDTPPPTVSGDLHVGHVFSFTHTDIVARYRRMCGRSVFYPMGWDDNGLPTERRVQNYFGVRCDPALPYDPQINLEQAAGGDQQPISRRNFIELCERLTGQDEQAFEELWRRVGLSVDWSLVYTTIGKTARAVSQRAFLRNLVRGEAYQAVAPTLWDVTFQTAVAQAELEDREVSGAFYRVGFRGSQRLLEVETTRPELLPACVALVAHPDDQRYQPAFGTTARHPAVRRRGPGRGAPARRPGKRHRPGNGLHVWRHHRRDLVARPRPSGPCRDRARRPLPPRLSGRSRGRRAVLAAFPDERAEGEAACRRPATRGGGTHRRAAARRVIRSSSTRRAISHWRSSPAASGISATADGIPNCARGCSTAAESSAGFPSSCASATSTGSPGSPATGW